MSAAAEHHGPLDQFSIQRIVEIDLGGVDVSFTNSAMMMVIAGLERPTGGSVHVGGENLSDLDEDAGAI